VKQVKRVYRLPSRKIGASGQINPFADSIFDRLADGHFVGLGFLLGESSADLHPVPLNNSVEESQL
jgi:hypothetical protein